MSKKRIIIIITIIILFLIAILMSFLYYEDKYVISFETGTDEEILNKYVDRNSKISLPKEPIKEGYIFVEWQYDGETFDFDTEIRRDMVLTAKWVKEEYINIYFDTTLEIKEDKILKGSSINELDEPVKEGYEFIGWYINDKEYKGEILNEDTTLVANYKEIIKEPTFNIGDIVVITGCYSKSSTSSYCNNTKAIGWSRKILNIIEGAQYPYVVGNNNGVTGFFKSDSINKK